MNFYSAKKDYLLLKSQIINLFVAFIISFIFVKYFNINGAAISLIFTGIFENLILKVITSNKREYLKVSW